MPNRPTNIERWSAGTGISADDRAMPDTDLGMFMPILGLAIKRIMADQRKKEQLEEFYGAPYGEFDQLPDREDYGSDDNELYPFFNEKFFDPEEKAENIGPYIRALKKAGLPIPPRMQVVQDYDIQEF